MSPMQILNKIKNMSHTELNNKKYANIEFIKNKIKNLEDLFDRKYLLKKVKVDKSYPKYILNNKKKFDNYIL